MGRPGTRFHVFRLALALSIAAAALALTLVAQAQGGSSFRTDLVSRANGTHGAGGNGDSFAGARSVSASGRFVAFESDADNLTSGDDNNYTNTFVRDRVEKRTILVSRRSGRHGGGADGDSASPSISANGRFVAFYSDADNLSGSDDNGVRNIFVRDLADHRTILASRRSGRHGGGADDGSYYPSISANGRFVVFESDADNLSSGDDNGVHNIFVRGLATHRTILASRGSGRHGAGADDHSYYPSISASGRFVTFFSYADNLSGSDDNSHPNIFARDLENHRMILASRGNGKHGGGGDDDSYDASISANGRFVAFESDADNLSSADDNNYQNIFVRDLENHRTILVSRRNGRHGGGGDGDCDYPSISASGRFVAFQSDADNLSGADNGSRDIFLRDLAGHRTILVSRQSGRHSGGADGYSEDASISANGRFVAFASDADNLSSADDNDFFNVFRRDVLGP